MKETGSGSPQVGRALTVLAAVREPVAGEQVRAFLEGYAPVEVVYSFQDFQKRLGQPWDFWVLDLHLNDLPQPGWLERQMYRPPTVVLAGFAQGARVAAWLRAGAHGFCPKPLDRDLLRVTLEMAWKGQQAQTLYRKVAIALAHHINNLLTLPLGMGKSFWRRWEAGEVVDEEEWEAYFIRVMKNLEKIHAVIRTMLELEEADSTAYWGAEQMLDLERHLEETFRKIDEKWSRYGG